MKRISLIPALLLGWSLTAAEQTPFFSTDIKGVIKVDNVAEVVLAHYGDKWVPNSQKDGSFAPVKNVAENNTSYAASWNMKGVNTPLEVKITQQRVSDNQLNVIYQLHAEMGIATESASVQILIPVWTMAGKKINIDEKSYLCPTEFKEMGIVRQNMVKRLEIPLTRGILDLQLPAPAMVALMDLRQFKQDFYCLRLEMLPAAKLLKAADLTIKMRFIDYQYETIDIRQAANMGFVDQVAGDQKGGWTDQGPTNDLRAIKPGKLDMPPVAVNIIDPAKNQGKSCIVLGGGGMAYMSRSAALPVDGKNFKTLLLLHALAWPPAQDTVIGTVKAVYQDGTGKSIPVIAGRDVNNWWNPCSLSNATVAWSAYSGESPIGLYLTPFALDDKPLKQLTLESSGKAVWLVVGAVGSPQTLMLTQTLSYQLFRNADWRPLETDQSVEAGSALDFSFLQDAPAGKYGMIKCSPQGHFVFEKRPDKAVRFYGANICFTANYNSKAQCDLLAERLARIGYNAVRLHHFDRNIIVQNHTDSVTFDTNQLDKIEYLIHAMKQRGIYITTDLFTLRNPAKGEYKTWPDPRVDDYKAAAMLLPEVRDNLKNFARKLLTHVNPYTGLAWKDDPVFVGISLLNENTILHIVTPVKLSPGVQSLYEKAFDQWAKTNGVTVTPQNKNGEYRRFLISVYNNYYDDMSRFMREIGVKAPLTDQNYIDLPYNTVERSKYDYVDNHIYWDHPQFIGKAWTLPTNFNNVSVMNFRLNVPKMIAPTRVLGKPFTVTEFDFCYPNEYRAEGGMVFGAYAALQDWSAVYRFDYSSSSGLMFSKNPHIEIFDVCNDPPRLLGERLGMAFFLRRDVAVSDITFPVAVSPDVTLEPFLRTYPRAATDLMLVGKVGSVLYDGKGRFIPSLPSDSKAVYNLAAGVKAVDLKLPLIQDQAPDAMFKELLAKKVLSADNANLSKDTFISSTGELTADFNARTFTAVTPRSEALLIPEKKTVSGNILSAQSIKNFAVVGAIAVDDRKLADSRRILILHLTDVKAEKTKFASTAMRLLLDNGKGQLLAKKGTVEISLKIGNLDGCKLYALDCSGRRLREIPFTVRSGGLSFTADTFCADKIVFAYELVRK